jgi:hypothetical protein
MTTYIQVPIFQKAHKSDDSKKVSQVFVFSEHTSHRINGYRACKRAEYRIGRPGSEVSPLRKSAKQE